MDGGRDAVVQEGGVEWRKGWRNGCCDGGGRRWMNGGMEAVMEEEGSPAGNMRESSVEGWRTDSHS